MVKVNLSEVVNLPAFEEAGRLFHKLTGMTLSFYDEEGNINFCPSYARCNFCSLVQNEAEGLERCKKSDKQAADIAFQTKQPFSYTCHAGLVDVVVPVVVSGEVIGCFFSGQMLPDALTQEKIAEIQTNTADLKLDTLQTDTAIYQIPILSQSQLELAMGLLSIICNHLVESEITLRQERDLTREQRKLRRSAEEKIHLERDLREVENRLVQAQLSPHFLFNALNLILGEAMSEGASRTSQLVGELSVLLRSVLTSIGSFVTLAQEVASTNAYLEIYKARFGHKIQLETDIPEELLMLRLPSLMMQPIVENSLVHALPVMNDTLCISIEARETNAGIEITVSDNGSDIDEKTISEINNSLMTANTESKLTGLLGVNRRIKYYYPDIQNIQVRNSGQGLAVIVTLPAVNQAKEVLA